MNSLLKLLKVAQSLAVKYFTYPDDAAAFIGVDLHNLTEKDLKSAYKKRALELHPDRNPGPDSESEFKSLQNAYKFLQEWLADDTDEWYYDTDERSEEEILRDQEEDLKYYQDLEKFNNKEKPELDKLSLLTMLKLYALADRISLPFHEYEMDRIDSAPDKELLDILINWKELFALRPTRMSSTDGLIKRKIYKRWYQGEFDIDLLTELPLDLRLRVMEEYAEYRLTQDEMKHEM